MSQSPACPKERCRVSPGPMIEASRQLTNRQCGLPLQKKKKNRQQNAFNPKPEGTLIAGMARTHEALVMQVDESGDDEKGKWHGKKTTMHGWAV